MKTINLFAFFMLFVLPVCAQTNNDQKSILNELARSRSAALIKGDTIRMKEILDEDFFYINSNGIKRNREQYLKNINLTGDSKWLGQEIDSMDIRLIGENAAILSFIVLDRFRFEGKNFNVYNRSTFVYARKDKTWKCVSGHTTEMGEVR